MITGLKKIYLEFPRQFWIVVLVSFIDKVGGTLVFPFFALYVTQKFHVGMTQAGIVLGIISFSSFVGGITQSFVDRGTTWLLIIQPPEIKATHAISAKSFR